MLYISSVAISVVVLLSNIRKHATSHHPSPIAPLALIYHAMYAVQHVNTADV